MFDWRKLKEEEIIELKLLIEKYREFEKIDVLIDIVLKKLGISKKEFNSRNIKRKRQISRVEQLPQSILYCDSDKCELPNIKKI